MRLNKLNTSTAKIQTSRKLPKSSFTQFVPGRNPSPYLYAPGHYPSPPIAPVLGNITKIYAKPDTQRVTKVVLDEAELKKLRYEYKKANKHRKSKIGIHVPRVSWCGTRCIHKDATVIEAVQGEKGGIYYRAMQRCGLVWFCPDCMYKLMRSRAEELYSQLMKYRAKGKTVLFATFTLQHHAGEKLSDLLEILKDAFTYANTHRRWKDAKKKLPVDFLRALEVLYGIETEFKKFNGWHPHYHCVFVGDAEIVEALKIFQSLYERRLSEMGKLVNENTVVIKKWNGDIDEMADYMCKGMLEQEMTGGNMKKSGSGKNFFQLIDEKNEPAIKEYVAAMKGKHQYHPSKGFFKDVRVKTDMEIIQDDKANDQLKTIVLTLA